MTVTDIFYSVLQEHQNTVSAILADEKIKKSIKMISEIILNAFKKQKKLLLCGNGGSAADAQHIAAEFVCRFYLMRRALNAEALSVNTSSLTAIANDFQFETVFARQVEAKGVDGDILLGFSTSGTSRNIIKAFEMAQSKNIVTICFTGEETPDVLKNTCDFILNIPSKNTPRIQECHIMAGHILCEFVEKELFLKE